MKVVCIILSAIFLWFNLTVPCFAQWVEDSKFAGMRVISLATSGSNLIVGTQYDGMYLSIDAGVTWENGGVGLGYSAQGLIFSGTNVLAGTYGGVFLSTDTGRNFSLVLGPLLSQFYSLEIADGNTFAGSNNGLGVYRSTDNGISWNQTGPGFQVWRLAVLGTTLFACERRTNGCEIDISTDNGASWNFSGGLSNQQVVAFGTSNTSLFAGTYSYGVFRYAGGVNWIAANAGLPSAVYSFAASGLNVFAGTAGNGVFLSSDNGSSWGPVNLGLANATVNALALCGLHLFAGADDGVWKRPISEITGIQVTRAPIPTTYSLEQNCPNPFNPVSTIGFSIAESGVVTLRVYDISGRELAVLVNERKAPGRYEVRFDATELTSGVYFYRLETGGFNQTQKMLLLK